MLLFAYGVIHGGSDAQILADGAASLNMGQTYIMTMIPAIFDNLGQALSLTTKVAEMSGKVGRAAEVFRATTRGGRPAKGQPNGSIAR